MPGPDKSPSPGKRQQPRGIVCVSVCLTLPPRYKAWLQEQSKELPGGMSEYVRRLIDDRRATGR